MLSNKTTTELITYWTKSSRAKLKTMKSLYASRRYADCLFFGHLTLERVIKAYVVKTTKEHAPRSHNLPYLVKLGGLHLDVRELELLEDVDTFNMAARYPDTKLSFYRKCTKKFTTPYHHAIISLHRKICRMLK